MEKTAKKGYETPATEVVEVTATGKICQSAETEDYVFGNEVKGVAQEVADASDLCLEIPQYGTKHSLNVSVSIGIVLWNIILNNFR